MNVKGDFKGNWKFFMWVNYEIITVLDKKQHEIRIALLVIKVIRKDCYHINEN